MEARRKAEEAERARLEEADRQAALQMQQQMEQAAKLDLENRERYYISPGVCIFHQSIFFWIEDIFYSFISLCTHR